MYISLPLHAVGHHARALALRHSAKSSCTQRPALDAARLRQLRRNLHKRARRLLADALRAVSHVAFVEMFQQAAVVQMQVEFVIGLIGRLGPRQREELRLAIGKRELLRVEQRLIRSIRRHGPLQRLVAFQPLVGHAREQRRERRDLVMISEGCA